MKTKFNYLLLLFISLLACGELQAQFGNRGYGNNRGVTGRPRLPQAETPPEPPKPKTADELVEAEMPKLIEALELDDFETAIMSSILKKYVQERIEAQILELPPEKMKETFKKIAERQDEELKASLPTEKFETFIKMREEGVGQLLRDKKKEEKKKKKKKKKTKD